MSGGNPFDIERELRDAGDQMTQPAEAARILAATIAVVHRGEPPPEPELCRGRHVAALEKARAEVVAGRHDEAAFWYQAETFWETMALAVEAGVWGGR